MVGFDGQGVVTVLTPSSTLLGVFLTYLGVGFGVLPFLVVLPFPGRAGFYWVLHNVIVIVPVVTAFVVACFGTTLRQLGQLIHRHAAKARMRYSWAVYTAYRTDLDDPV